MIILELDDFDYLTDDLTVFSPIFVYLISWAKKMDGLSFELEGCDVFTKKYHELESGVITFHEFVDLVLDGKILDSYFKENVLSFIESYVEYEYAKDLVNCFQLNIWELPSEFLFFDMICPWIDKSYQKYNDGENVR